jgi:hypothetical protein
LRSVAPSFAHGSRTKSRSLQQAVSRRGSSGGRTRR